jgi:hypothetical protein
VERNEMPKNEPNLVLFAQLITLALNAQQIIKVRPHHRLQTLGPRVSERKPHTSPGAARSTRSNEAHDRRVLL